MQLMAFVLSAVALFSSMTTDLFAQAGPESIMLLVNRDNKIEYTYVPEPLVLPEVRAAKGKETAIQLREEPARALEELFADAEAAGHTLYAVSGYRSYGLQKTIFNRKVEAVGEKRAMLTVAPAGASEHQLGLAMDVNGETTVKLGLVEAFGESPEGQWVYENAHLYGFIIRYQQGKTDITGYAWEPWHLRYIGVEAATEVFELDITFEEYHELLKERRINAVLWPEGKGDTP